MKAVIFVTLLLLTACASGLSEEEIQAKVLEANTGINYYKVDSTINMVSETKGQTINMDMKMSGEVNREEKTASISSTTSISAGSFQTSIEQEIYLVDEYVYSKISDKWIKTKIQGSWGDQDQAEQYALLLENGNMEIKGTETMDGKEYYVVGLTLDSEFLNKYLSITSSDEQFENVEFSNYDITFYINTETFVIERTIGKLSVSQTVLEERISMDMDMDTRIYDLNIPVTIEVPQEALEAKNHNENLIGSY